MKYRIFFILAGVVLAGAGCRNVHVNVPEKEATANPSAVSSKDKNTSSVTAVDEPVSERHISKPGEIFPFLGLLEIPLPAGLEVESPIGVTSQYKYGRIQNYTPSDDTNDGLKSQAYFIEFVFDGKPFSADACKEAYTKGVISTFLNRPVLYCTKRQEAGETITSGYGYIINSKGGTLQMHVYGSGQGLQKAESVLKNINWKDI